MSNNSNAGTTRAIGDLSSSNDFFVEIAGSHEILGRLSLIKLEKSFSLEIDLVFEESKKIFRHIAVLHHLQSAEEAVKIGHQKLAHYLKE